MSDAQLPLPLRFAPLRNPRLSKRLRRFYNRLLRHRSSQLILLILTITLVFLLIHFHPLSDLIHSTKRTQTPHTTLFIAIGSAPSNIELRDAARRGWLRWLPSDGTVSYRFFSDAPPPPSAATYASSHVHWSSLRRESKRYNDMVLQPLPSGYGSNEHNLYAQRARFQARWAVRYVPDVSFFLRVDDDAFLCLHRLLYEVKALPKRQLFWGRFWCREGRNRADENFMLFSRDVLHLLADDTLVGRILPYDDQVTLGWNFGYWSWVLNLTIFDDQKRLDAQQGYLTEYMHSDTPQSHSVLGAFCDDFMYAHHVKPATMLAAYEATKTHLMYQLPVLAPPADTCPRNSQTFVPARHSKKLPDLRIGRSANGP